MFNQKKKFKVPNFMWKQNNFAQKFDKDIGETLWMCVNSLHLSIKQSRGMKVEYCPKDYVGIEYL